MVASFDLIAQLAHQKGQGVGQLRQLIVVGDQFDAIERIIVVGVGEGAEQLIVLGAENVETDAFGFAGGLRDTAVGREGDGDHGRVESCLFHKAAEHADGFVIEDAGGNVEAAGDAPDGRRDFLLVHKALCRLGAEQCQGFRGRQRLSLGE